jgi:hypothetical protein
MKTTTLQFIVMWHLIVAWLSTSVANAEVQVHRPSDDRQVVLRLSNPNGSALSRLRADVRANPNDSDAQARYVEALIDAGVRSGNERYYGFAEQSLNEAPTDVQRALQVEKAQLLQRRHDFRSAEEVLGKILASDSRNRVARLMRAQVRLHLHQPQQAMRDCVALVPLTDLLTSTTCFAQARMALGEVSRAYALVTAIDSPSAPTATRSWSAGVAAEAAARMGKSKEATQWYRLAYELDSTSHFPRIAYADWLLSQSQFAQAQDIAGTGSSNADRLRMVLAKRNPDDRDALQLQLAWREASNSGARDHLRDQARFTLLVTRDLALAHAIARDNFQDHQEADDALLLAETAKRTNDAISLQLIRAWQHERHYVDARLNQWMEKT